MYILLEDIVNSEMDPFLNNPVKLKPILCLLLSLSYKCGKDNDYIVFHFLMHQLFAISEKEYIF